MGFATSRDGTRIYYELLGEQHPETGGVLLCHPSFSSHRLWHLLGPELATRRRFVAWDYRGHGRSDAPLDPARYGMTQMLEDLEAVQRAAFGDAAVHLGGLSFGGTLAMQRALDASERVRSLLLFNTGPGFRKPEAQAQWRDMLERSAAKFERVGVAKYLEGERARAELLGLHAAHPRSRPLYEALLESRPEALALFARHVAACVPNLVDRLTEIQLPALVLIGEKDQGFQAASRVLEAKLGAATRIEIANAGHAANLDQPQAFLASVNDHLERQATD